MTDTRADVVFRQAVKRRDGACVVCGKTEALHVHHLITRSVRAYRHDIDNGVTLCVYCHQHWPYAPHVSPSKWMSWLDCMMPSKAQWIREHRWRRGK
jgi:5-methylcytosine-specific restriction endonuclease McrA